MNAFSMPGAESTSAALRRVEQERDDWIRAHDRVVETCVRVGKERDEAARRAADLEQVREELTQMRIRAESEAELTQSLVGEKQELINQKLALKAELASARTELDAVRTARDRLDRELGELKAVVIELKAVERIPATKWVVAIGGDGPCALCGREIQRGEAYEYTPATEWRAGQCTHVDCPNNEGAPPA